MARLFGELDRFGIAAEIAASWIDDPGSVRNPVVRDMLFRAGRDDAAVAAYPPESSLVKPTMLSVESAEAPSTPEGGNGEEGTATLSDAAVGELPQNAIDAEAGDEPRSAFSGEETEVAVAPLAALAPAVVGAGELAAVGKAILGALATMGILSLPGDSVQQEGAPGSEGGAPGEGAKNSDDIRPGAGQPQAEPPDNGDESSPPPANRPGGRGKRASDSSKGERHGDADAVDKANRRIEELERQRNAATSRKDRNRIRRRIRNISKGAQKDGKGATHHRRGNPLKGGKR